MAFSAGHESEAKKDIRPESLVPDPNRGFEKNQRNRVIIFQKNLGASRIWYEYTLLTSCQIRSIRMYFKKTMKESDCNQDVVADTVESLG